MLPPTEGCFLAETRKYRYRQVYKLDIGKSLRHILNHKIPARHPSSVFKIAKALAILKPPSPRGKALRGSQCLIILHFAFCTLRFALSIVH